MCRAENSAAVCPGSKNHLAIRPSSWRPEREGMRPAGGPVSSAPGAGPGGRLRALLGAGSAAGPHLPRARLLHSGGLRLARIVVGIHVVDLPWTFAIELQDRVIGRAGEVLHAGRQREEAALLEILQ